MDQTSLPILSQLHKHIGKGNVRLHVPGHAGGGGIPADLPLLFNELAKYDLTELPGLDDLHKPCGMIRDAQDLAAVAFGANQSYFLVNGASAGVMAMILATCGPGDNVLVPRNAHSSVYHGLVYSGAIPRYIPVACDKGFPLNVTVEEIEAGFHSCPDAKAVVVTSPSYYGVCADIKKIEAAVRRHNAYLLLDEAHGAHLGFSPVLPSSSGRMADLRVQSWHKTLGALTPGAVLHRQGSRIDPFRLRAALQSVQTSSPSYPLLLSLDATRKQMALQGKEIWTGVCNTAETLRDALRTHFPLLERNLVCKLGFDLDLTRVTVLTGQAGVSGVTAARLLRESGVETELACSGHILAVLGIGSRALQMEKTVAAFQRLTGYRGEPIVEFSAVPDPDPVISPRQAWFGAARFAHPREAVGGISASFVVPYPPGIPVLAAGERVSEQVADYLAAAGNAGIELRGLDRQGRLRICL
ncbi:MAG: aminotransferase class I/II-fold pyridoxal phosphate-dependent enzyme [Clostridiales bacterium]|jgi:arginine/lysine/ornithine decarboxylase|nr:aminotransferase class I/II-fold pyridoxal phosphate-dependent enzyme [Clostridiales bacterium]